MVQHHNDVDDFDLDDILNGGGGAPASPGTGLQLRFEQPLALPTKAPAPPKPDIRTLEEKRFGGLITVRRSDKADLDHEERLRRMYHASIECDYASAAAKAISVAGVQRTLAAVDAFDWVYRSLRPGSLTQQVAQRAVNESINFMLQVDRTCSQAATEAMLNARDDRQH